MVTRYVFWSPLQRRGLGGKTEPEEPTRIQPCTLCVRFHRVATCTPGGTSDIPVHRGGPPSHSGQGSCPKSGSEQALDKAMKTEIMRCPGLIFRDLAPVKTSSCWGVPAFQEDSLLPP